MIHPVVFYSAFTYLIWSTWTGEEMKTASVNKQDLMQHAQQDMQKWISDSDLTDRQKLALTCRILFDHGHDAGLAGQITCRSENEETFITQRFGLGFDEITA